MSHPRSGGSFTAQCFEDVDAVDGVEGVDVVEDVDAVDGDSALVSNDPEIFFHYFTEVLVKQTAANAAKAKDLLKCLLFSYCRQMWAQR